MAAPMSKREQAELLLRLFRQQEAALASEHALQRAALRSLLSDEEPIKQEEAHFARSASAAETAASGGDIVTEPVATPAASVFGDVDQGIGVGDTESEELHREQRDGSHSVAAAFQDEGADAAAAESGADAQRTAQVECISESECEIVEDRCDQLTSEERQTGRISPPGGRSMRSVERCFAACP